MHVDEDEARRLIGEGEGSRVEFKLGLPRDAKVARTLAAFANTRGGHLFVGVDDRGQLVGAVKPREVERALRRIAEASIEPPVTARVQTLALDGHPIVIATVGLSDARPHAVERSAGEPEHPVRVGSSTRAASGPALEALRHGRRAGGLAGLAPLERQILAWIEQQGDAGTTAQTRCTPQAFAKARNVGLARARRAFVKLERSGHLVGQGSGARRAYGRP